MEYAQLKRLLAVSTPLGEDVLLLDSFQGTEGLSVPFQFMLDMVSLDESLSFDKIVGHPLTVTIRRADGTERYFNGIVSRFSQGATDRNLTAYRAEIVPWLWLLTQTADCRIFQQKSVPDILKIIFDDQGFQDFRMDLRGTYEALEYCVQYRETTFNFVSRLLEEYGIYYFVEHEATKHTIVFSDHPNGHPVCAAQERATYGGVAGGKTQEDTIAEWQVEQEVRPGKYALTDYNFTMPSSSLAVTIAGNGTYLRHAQGQAGAVPAEPARQARRLLRPFGHRGRPRAEAASVRAAEEDGAGALQAVHLQQARRAGPRRHDQAGEGDGRAPAA